jgi:hypothetical protein
LGDERELVTLRVAQHDAAFAPPFELGDARGAEGLEVEGVAVEVVAEQVDLEAVGRGLPPVDLRKTSSPSPKVSPRSRTSSGSLSTSW